MQYLQGQRLLILGLGISGLSMARWCVRCGAVVRVADTRSNPPGLAELQTLVPDLDFVAGEFNAELLHHNDGEPAFTQVLRSPGLLPQDAGLRAVLAAAQQRGITIQGELDLFALALKQIDAQKTQEEELVLAKALEERELKAHEAKLEGSSSEEVLPEESSFEEGASEETITNADDWDDASEHVANIENDQSDERLDHDEYHVVALDVHALDLSLEADLEKLFSEVEEPVIAQIIEPLPLVQGYKPKIIAITGTNGKTTVTSLTALLAQRAGKTVVAAGNIGTAMMDALSQQVDAGQLPQVWVLELSSFQLEGAVAFDPTVATILNLTQDHLDWHETMANYIAAKEHVFGAHTTRLLNRDDEQVMAFKLAPVVVEKPAPKRRKGVTPVAAPAMVTFGNDTPRRAGDFGIVNDGGMPWLAQAVAAHETAMDTYSLTMRLLMPVDVLKIRGRHNANNALAALALASHVGCDIAPMLFGLREYRGEPHRVEFIANINGIEYVDDSKGTNVGATAAALAGLGIDHRIVLILGGQGKGQDFSSLVPLVKSYARAVVLIGQDALLIEAALKDAQVPMLHAKTLPQAVALCTQQASAGDVVLLSPACASLDMFSNYVERAQVFADAVRDLAQGQGQVTLATPVSEITGAVETIKTTGGEL